ncbi:hypothetical protein HDU76_006338 [Blyttiomyces sp. JEL0837]|nr:hypothetical protein HDU76_006338 [Blyttiomyces sp. JEL0837]
MFRSSSTTSNHSTSTQSSQPQASYRHSINGPIQPSSQSYPHPTSSSTSGINRRKPVNYESVQTTSSVNVQHQQQDNETGSTMGVVESVNSNRVSMDSTMTFNSRSSPDKTHGVLKKSVVVVVPAAEPTLKRQSLQHSKMVPYGDEAAVAKSVKFDLDVRDEHGKNDGHIGAVTNGSSNTSAASWKELYEALLEKSQTTETQQAKTIDTLTQRCQSLESTVKELQEKLARFESNASVGAPTDLNKKTDSSTYFSGDTVDSDLKRIDKKSERMQELTEQLIKKVGINKASTILVLSPPNSLQKLLAAKKAKVDVTHTIDPPCSSSPSSETAPIHDAIVPTVEFTSLPTINASISESHQPQPPVTTQDSSSSSTLSNLLGKSKIGKTSTTELPGTKAENTNTDSMSNGGISMSVSKRNISPSTILSKPLVPKDRGDRVTAAEKMEVKESVEVMRGEKEVGGLGGNDVSFSFTMDFPKFDGGMLDFGSGLKGEPAGEALIDGERESEKVGVHGHQEIEASELIESGETQTEEVEVKEIVGKDIPAEAVTVIGEEFKSDLLSIMSSFGF